MKKQRSEFFGTLLTVFSFFIFKIISSLKNSKNSFFNLVRNIQSSTKYFFALNSKYFRALKNKWVLVWGSISLVLIATAVVIIINITVGYYMLSYDGVTLGYTRNPAVVETTINSLKNQFENNQNVNEDLDNVLVTEVQSSNLFLSCLNKDEIETVIVSAVKTIEYAHCVYIDNTLIFATTSEKKLNNALNDYKNDRITLSKDINTKYDSCDIEFLCKFEIKKECVLVDILTKTNIYETVYNIFENNLPYRITCLQTEEVSVPYVTYYERNNNLYSGSRKVVVEGKNGTKNVQSKLIVENGILISEQVVNEVTVRNPITKKIQIGNGITGGFDKKDILLLPDEGYVTSPYGDRLDPFTREPDFHKGMDIASTTGTPIIAASGGKIIQASDKKNGYGNCVIIEHYSGFRTLYAHCSELLVEVGDYVSAGQTIAKVGSTGRSTGPHLHFSVIIDGKYVDPSIYL